MAAGVTFDLYTNNQSLVLGMDCVRKCDREEASEEDWGDELAFLYTFYI